MRSPYVKLYRDEPGAYGQLPLLTRALGSQLLKLADNDGVIHLGKRSPHEAVCFGMGAECRERRSIRGHIERLLEAGYLVLDDTRRTLTIPSYPRIGETPTEPQPSHSGAPAERQRSADEAVAERQPSADEAPAVRQRCADGAPAVRQLEAKCAESHTADTPKLREEENREDESRSAPERATPPVPRLFDAMSYHPAHPVVVAVVESWRAGYLEAWGRPYVPRGHGDALAAGRLAHWCELHAEATGADPAEVAGRIVGHFLAAKHAAGGTVPAQTWLDPDHPQYPLDPAGYLEPPQARPRVARARGPKPPSPPELHQRPPDAPEPPPLPEDMWATPLPTQARSLA